MCSSSRLPRLDDALELCLDLAAVADSLPAPMMTSNAVPASTSPSAGTQAVAWGWASLADAFLVLCGGAGVACVGRSLSAACMLTSTPLAPTEGFFFACRGASETHLRLGVLQLGFVWKALNPTFTCEYAQ